MAESGRVTRDNHSATYEVCGGMVRIVSAFGTVQARLEGAPAEAIARALLGEQIGQAARVAGPADKAEAARLLQTEWDVKWNVPTPLAPWADRPPPVEVIEAADSGWLPKTGRMIDLGCGTAEIAAWFAERGIHATAVDIAQAAVNRAAARHAHLAKSMAFVALDLTTGTLPDAQFDILVDRGCLHQIPRNLVSDYVHNIAAMAAPAAKMMLFMKAFRGNTPFGDAAEAEERTDWVRRAFAGHFDLERAEPTYLSAADAKAPLPGMAFWLSRTAAV